MTFETIEMYDHVLQTEYDNANRVIAEIEDELNELGTEKHLIDRKKEVQDKLKANRDKLNRFKVSLFRLTRYIVDCDDLM